MKNEILVPSYLALATNKFLLNDAMCFLILFLALATYDGDARFVSILVALP